MRKVVRQAPALPFLKWVGGKGKLLHQLEALLPVGYGGKIMRHVEPFMGGGALFFRKRPERALLADVNEDLMSTYRQVRDDLDGVLKWAEQYAMRHSEDFYYAVRDAFNDRLEHDKSDRAAMFIYLNKTCFNGVYRVNKRGRFNVPIGRYKNPTIVDVPKIRIASRALDKAELLAGATFDEIVSEIRVNDFVYMDPPYEPTSRTANFTSYAQDGFTQDDQRRLAGVFRRLAKKGTYLMLSNSDTPFIHSLYQGFDITIVQAPRSINSDGEGRGMVNEIVVRNYKE